MPGFDIGGSGAITGSDPAGLSEVKRKYRWTLTIIEDSGFRPNTLVYLESAKRPAYSTGELEQKHNQETIYHIGQTKWDPMDIVFYDMEQPIDVSIELWKWLNSRVNVIMSATVFVPATYKRNFELEMLSAAGETVEQWMVYQAWPSKIDWGDLAYTSEDLAKITATLRYDRANKVQ